MAGDNARSGQEALASLKQGLEEVKAQQKLQLQSEALNAVLPMAVSVAAEVSQRKAEADKACAAGLAAAQQILKAASDISSKLCGVKNQKYQALEALLGNPEALSAYAGLTSGGQPKAVIKGAAPQPLELNALINRLCASVTQKVDEMNAQNAANLEKQAAAVHAVTSKTEQAPVPDTSKPAAPAAKETPVSTAAASAAPQASGEAALPAKGGKAEVAAAQLYASPTSASAPAIATEATDNGQAPQAKSDSANTGAASAQNIDAQGKPSAAPAGSTNAAKPTDTATPSVTAPETKAASLEADVPPKAEDSAGETGGSSQTAAEKTPQKGGK